MNSLKLLLTMAIIFATVLTSCNQTDEPKSASAENSTKVTSMIRTVADAQNIAIAANKAFYGSSFENRSTPSVKEVIAYVSNTSSRALSHDTLMYVVNFAEDAGFVIIPAQRDAEEYIAVTELGNYNPYVKTGNEGFDMYMDMTKAYLSQISPQADFIKVTYDTVMTKQVGPLHDLKWGTELPEGKFAPNSIAGCVPLAMMFAMSYCELPNSMTYTFPERDIDSESLNWTEIKKHKQSQRGCYAYKYSGHYLSCQASEETHTTIARIARQIGILCDANYSNSTLTFAWTIDAVSQINPLIGNKISASSVWNSENIKNNIEQNRIVLLEGDNTSGNIGHIWMCDGYRNLTTEQYIQQPSSSELVLSGIKTQHTWFHYNWGFSGYFNGYYSAGTVYPKDAHEFDSTPDSHIPLFGLKNLYYYSVTK